MIDVTKFEGHTPGPWKITHGGFSTDDGFSIGSDNAAALRVKVVCECWPCTIVDQQHREELLANASLIAAAPELLAEVLRLRRIVSEMWDTFYGQGLEVANWHLNGELERMDTFFESNDWNIEAGHKEA